MEFQLLQKLGNIDQIAGIREMECGSGSARGLRMIEVYNAAGLRFTLLPDRCLDIHDFSFKGHNLAFHSKNGLTAARSLADDEFFTLWPGGMLSTCGLLNVGNACMDGGNHPIHGRIGSTPARHVSVSEGWVGNDYVLSVSAEMWETRLYGHQLSLHRTVTTGIYDRTVAILDTLTNHSMADEEFMLLYHVNFGYPLLDASSIFVCSPATMQPRGSHAMDSVHMCEPGYEPGHQLYLHSFDESNARAAIINPDLQLAGFVAFETANLPYLMEWKHMAAHDYVVALEPCNCVGLGRVAERENGTLKVLPAYGSISHRLSLGVLDGVTEIQSFEKTCENRANII